MPKIVISDASSLILFDNIGELELLNALYTNVCTTIEVANEFGQELPVWISIEEVKDKKYQKLLETEVDLGEASAIALASEIDSNLLLLDDLKARKLASKLNLRFTGALGVIHKAKQVGIIYAVKPIIDKILATNFRISDKIVKELLRQNNE